MLPKKHSLSTKGTKTHEGKRTEEIFTTEGTENTEKDIKEEAGVNIQAANNGKDENVVR